MSNLRDLLNRANSTVKPAEPKKEESGITNKPAPQTEPSKTQIVQETNISEDAFDDLDTFMQDLSTTAVPPNFSQGVAKDGNKLEVGDPVTGIHKAQNMSGQVIGINGDNVTVEWKNRDQSTVSANTLIMSNVDDDYQEETMYIESAHSIQNMGFDKEAFYEDTDLESLLRGGVDGSSGFKYGSSDDI